MFESVPVEVLEQHAPQYDAKYHRQLLCAAAKLRFSKLRMTEQTDTKVKQELKKVKQELNYIEESNLPGCSSVTGKIFVVCYLASCFCRTW